MDGYASSLVEAFDTSLLLTDEQVDWVSKGSMNQARQSLGCHVGSFEGSHGIFAAGGNGNGLTVGSWLPQPSTRQLPDEPGGSSNCGDRGSVSSALDQCGDL